MTEDYFTIRKASPADLPRIHGIYAAARQFMRDHGNFIQWDGEDAPEHLLPGDIEAGNLYVLEENGVIHAAFAFIIGADPCYAVIEQEMCIRDRFQRVDHTADGIDDAAGEKPCESGRCESGNDLADRHDAYPAHRDVDHGGEPLRAVDPEGIDDDAYDGDAPDKGQPVSYTHLGWRRRGKTCC